MAASRILYGVPVSQPVRAVLWLCASQELPIELKKTIPPKQTKSPEFLALNPRGKIPVLQEDDFVLAEGAAIAQYLAESNGWDALYPKDARRRAKIHEALSWSGAELRPSTFFVAPLLRPDIVFSERRSEAMKKEFGKNCDAFERILASNGGFAAAGEPTLADYFTYAELGQFRVGFDVSPLTGERMWDFAPWSGVSKWLDAMAALPGHDEMHAPLVQYAGYLKAQAAKAKP